MSDVKLMVRNAQTTKLDGVEGISKSEFAAIKESYQNRPQSAESIKWLEKTHPQLHAAITSDLDYGGYVGTAIGSLNSTRAGDELATDAARRSAKLNQLPPLKDFGENGLPKSLGGGENIGKNERGEQGIGYNSNGNYTKVVGDSLSKITDDQARASRGAQRDYTAKMSGIIGADVSNPPSMAAARGYFQTLANRGASPAEIKKEYGEYLKTFYRHPGGVEWSPKLDPKNIDGQIAKQPVAKDGKRLVDCEGFSGITENVLGSIKAKDGKPMFEIQHASNSSHITTGVFPRGKDAREGFVVDNTNVSDFRRLDARGEADYAASPKQSTRQRYLVREHMRATPVGPPTHYGETMDGMTRPGEKVKLTK